MPAAGAVPAVAGPVGAARAGAAAGAGRGIKGGRLINAQRLGLVARQRHGFDGRLGRGRGCLAGLAGLGPRRQRGQQAQGK